MLLALRSDHTVALAAGRVHAFMFLPVYLVVVLPHDRSTGGRGSNRRQHWCGMVGTAPGILKIFEVLHDSFFF